MKPRTRVLAAAAVIVFASAAAPRAESRMEVGPKLGLGFVTMTGSDASALPITEGTDPGYLVRGHAGAFVSFFFNGQFALQAEVAFVQRGAEWDKSVSRNDTTATATQTCTWCRTSMVHRPRPDKWTGG